MNHFFKTKKINLILWATFSVLIGIFLASVVFLPFDNLKSEKVLKPRENTAAVTLASPKNEAPAAQYFYVNKDQDGEPKVSAKAFLVGDLDTGEIILSQNPNAVFPLASVSKLMTALVTKEIANPNDTTTISKEALATEGKNGELKLGEKIKVTDLLYPLLLESSNDAAEALAEHFDRDSFLSKMNEVAKQLNMTGTSYEDPSGLSENNKSTVFDMFKLAGYITRQQPDLFKITTLRSYYNKKQSWSNISQFLGDSDYLGGKSGYTSAAKQTVVSLFSLPLGQNGDRPIAITLLQSTDRRKDVETILRYLQKNIYYGGTADANTNWVAERVNASDLQDQNFVALAFAGDIMLDRGVRNSVVKNFNDDYSALFENSNILQNADISVANLEGTASDQGVDQENLYSFRMDPAVVPALKGAGIDVLSVANNHIGDWGRPAFTDTLAHLTENEISYIGGGNNKTEAETPVIIEKYGMKIGFLGFSDKGPDSMTAGPNTPGILLASDPDFDLIIKNAAKQVDDLVVYFHFGEEYQTKHDVRQESLAHEAIDDGARIVIGSHSHVVEETEVYKNGFIAYSLGNFIFDQSWSAPTMQGMLLQIKLFNDGSMTVQKNPTQLSPAFQLNAITEGKEEKIKFQE